jgi:hypothetical protein
VKHDRQDALHGRDLEHLRTGELGRVVHQAEVQQQMRDRAVAMAGAALGLVDSLVDPQLAAGGVAEPGEDPIEGRFTVARVQQRGHRDRAGVDHRVVRAVRVALKLDRIEDVAARLDADVLATVSAPKSSTAIPNVNGFETDWIVNGRSRSPVSNTAPSAVAMQMPKSSGLAFWSSGM